MKPGAVPVKENGQNPGFWPVWARFHSVCLVFHQPCLRFRRAALGRRL